ncbi:MAG: DUF4491 family protein [Bacteroidaceae bacterium]|nr:DUF4491 family protein [Bacteroidaceae bacterium]
MTLHFDGLIVGVSAFLIIGLFHPVVIKAEYYFGTRLWWVFLLLGCVCAVVSLMIANTILSVIVGVLAFCLFWSIPELFQQEKRVQKGWFPRNPKRKY